MDNVDSTATPSYDHATSVQKNRTVATVVITLSVIGAAVIVLSALVVVTIVVNYYRDELLVKEIFICAENTVTYEGVKTAANSPGDHYLKENFYLGDAIIESIITVDDSVPQMYVDATTVSRSDFDIVSECLVDHYEALNEARFEAVRKYNHYSPDIDREWLYYRYPRVQPLDSISYGYKQYE